MAIEFEQKSKVRWSRVLMFIVIIGAVGLVTYFLFFAPSPKIELIIPAPLERAGEVSSIQFIDPGQIVRSQAFSVLREYAGDPGPGVLGRPNPFLPL